MVQFRTLLKFVLLFSCASAYGGKGYDPVLVSSMLGGAPLDGYFGDADAEGIGEIRAVRFILDGENARLLRAGRPTIELPEKRLVTMKGRHPSGPWPIFVFRWVLPNETMVEIAFRTDQALEFEAIEEYGGQIENLPRALLSILNTRTGEIIGQGGLASDDQPEIIEDMRAFFKKVGVRFVTFQDAQKEECEKLLTPVLIRTRR